MKRSQTIRLVLVGSIATGAMSGCDSNPSATAVSAGNVYTNNFYVQGIGYYHAPFRTFYQVPYNFFEPKSGRYFFGGQWATAPHSSITNISSPTPEVASNAEAHRTDVRRDTYYRSGFGSTSRHYSTWS